jgi:hypothetical protein
VGGAGQIEIVHIKMTSPQSGCNSRMLLSRYYYGNESSKQQEGRMGTLVTIKFGLGIALVLLGALVAAFFCYMSIFGKRSSLRQKGITETDKTV